MIVGGEKGPSIDKSDFGSLFSPTTRWRARQRRLPKSFPATDVPTSRNHARSSSASGHDELAGSEVTSDRAGSPVTSATRISSRQTAHDRQSHPTAFLPADETLPHATPKSGAAKEPSNRDRPPPSRSTALLTDERTCIGASGPSAAEIRVFGTSRRSGNPRRIGKIEKNLPFRTIPNRQLLPGRVFGRCVCAAEVPHPGTPNRSSLPNDGRDRRRFPRGRIPRCLCTN